MTVAATWPEPEDDRRAREAATTAIDAPDLVLDAGEDSAVQEADDHDEPPGVGGVAVVPAPTRSGGHLPHFPAIEGLRGLAVAGVLVFHGGFTWMKGGYLGVSTFFTLSGFLITSLLLAERAMTSSIDLRRFWVRRARRLMPASLAALALIGAFGLLAASDAQKRNLAGDALAALGYVANWRFLFSHQSYGDLFAAPSPVLHFWSLAIEEQFYLVFPLLAWFVLKKLKVQRLGFAALLVVLAAGSLALTLYGGLSHDAIYYNTFTRAIEMLIGALLATLVYHRRVTTLIAHHRGVRAVVALSGIAALAGCLYLWVRTDQTEEWLYRGGFAAYALLSSILIVAAIAPYGLVRHVLGLRPLRWLGAISYGVYLFHWPVFLWLNPERTGWSEPVLFAPRVLITVAIAMVSLRYLETPIRKGERLGRIRPQVIAPFAAVAIAATVIAVSVTAPAPLIDFETAEQELANTRSEPGTGPIDITSQTPPFPRMAIFGDSTALMTGLGLNKWAQQTKKATFVKGDAKLGCGIGRGGMRMARGEDGKEVPAAIDDVCNRWERNWHQEIVDNEPNVAIVSVGPWEVVDRLLPGDTVWRHLGDPVYDAYLAQEFDLAVQTLSSDGAMVVFVTSPPTGANEGVDPITARGPAAEPARMNRLNELIKALPAKHPGKVQIVDLAAWLTASGDDARLRPDGVHLGFDPDGDPAKDTSVEVATRFLGDALIDAYHKGWDERKLLPAMTSTTLAPTGGTDPSTFDQKRQVVVMGDETATPVADALADWGARHGGTIEVVKAIGQGCGYLTTVGRKRDGVPQTTPECAGVAYGRLQIVAATKPDLIVVVPSRWDFVDLLLPFDTAYRSWDDPFFVAAANEQITRLTSALNRVEAPVIWLDSTTLIGSDAEPPAERTQPFAKLLNDLGPIIGYSANYQVGGLAKYVHDRAAEGTAVFEEGGVISFGANAAFADWLGNDLLSSYDTWVAGGKRTSSDEK